MKNVVCLGDSQTDGDAGYGVHGFDTWPAVLQRSLRASGFDVRVRSFGVGGDTSAQALARVQDCFAYCIPDAAVVYIGVNDPGAPITTNQSQANIQAIVKALKHRAVGDGIGSGPTVAAETNLPATGGLGQRYVVLADGSSTGGMTAFDADHHTTITGSVAADANGYRQSVWEYRYSAAGVLGWGRVAINTTAPLVDQDGISVGCPNVVILSTNYLNFTTGGDTTTVPYTAYANVRGAQSAAATAETATGATVTYADLYTAQKALITGGSVVDQSVSGYDAATTWHYKQNNQHHNAFGHGLVAQAARASVATALA